MGLGARASPHPVPPVVTLLTLCPEKMDPMYQNSTQHLENSAASRSGDVPVRPIEIKETGVSLGRRSLSPQCRQRTAILLLQLWQGCQVCEKIAAQLPSKASQFNILAEITLGY